MSEKAKNDHLPPPRRHTIAAWGCFILLLVGGLGLLFLFIELDQPSKFDAAIDLCTGMIHNVHADFQVAGQVVDEQGQPIAHADIKLDGLGIRECDETIRIHRTQTDKAGAFAIGPVLFEYVETFFVIASTEGCQSEPVYGHEPVTETMTIVLQCPTTP